jgi:photoactive yellow protein
MAGFWAGTGRLRLNLEAAMNCVWCGKETKVYLCSECEQVSTGIPGLSKEELDKLPFGVIELNRDGVIISFNQAEEGLSRRSKVDAIGRNFFTEVAPCADVQDFRGRFDEFLTKDSLSENFDYVYYFGSRAVAVMITFLRVNQQIALVLSKRVDR